MLLGCPCRACYDDAPLMRMMMKYSTLEEVMVKWHKIIFTQIGKPTYDATGLFLLCECNIYYPQVVRYQNYKMISC